MKAKVIL